jgi:hypothetical protein
MRSKNHVRLELEALESRLAPAYLSYDPGNFGLLITNNLLKDYTIWDSGLNSTSGFSLRNRGHSCSVEKVRILCSCSAL